MVMGLIEGEIGLVEFEIEEILATSGIPSYFMT
jgi:hypothetical protein